MYMLANLRLAGQILGNRVPLIPLPKLSGIFRVDDFYKTLTAKHRLAYSNYETGSNNFSYIFKSLLGATWKNEDWPSNTASKIKLGLSNIPAKDKPQINFVHAVYLKPHPWAGITILSILMTDTDLEAGKRHVRLFISGLLQNAGKKRGNVCNPYKLMINGKNVAITNANIDAALRYAEELVKMIFEKDLYDAQAAWETVGLAASKLRSPKQADRLAGRPGVEQRLKSAIQARIASWRKPPSKPKPRRRDSSLRH